jgi:acyl carrier protein
MTIHTGGTTVSSTADEVRDVLVTTLGIQDRAQDITPQTPLMDGLPELDSMAVVELLVALEGHFGITIDDGDVTGDVFETLGSLADFVQERLTPRA